VTATEVSREHAIRVLGPLEVRDGDKVVEVTGVKRQAVLALLVLDEGRPVPLDRLIARLWPYRAPATAAAAVRNNISALRRVLDPLAEVSIETIGSSYLLRLVPGALDAQTARARIQRGLRLLDRGDGAEDAERELRDALALWRGGMLPNLRQAGYEWAELADLEELWLVASEGVTEAALRCGRHREVVPRLQRLVRQHPEREAFHRQRVAALAAAGRPADAVTAFHEARTALRTAGRPVGVALAAAHREVVERASGGSSRTGVRAHPAADRPSVALCVRFTADGAGLEQECRSLAAAVGTVVSSRPGVLVLVTYADGPAVDVTVDAAVETALAWRRRSRERGCGTPTVAVVAGRVDALGRAVDPASELAERAAALAERIPAGGVSVG
jgi:DNA-binding SARP family transcriptional activator